MKILFDINIILDVMLIRERFINSALQLLVEVEKKNIYGFLCESSITTIHYLIESEKNTKLANEKVAELLKIFNLSSIDKTIFESALSSKITDFEDAVIHESALRQEIDGIVTRNIKDFKHSKISVYDPDELLTLLNTMNED